MTKRKTSLKTWAFSTCGALALAISAPAFGQSVDAHEVDIDEQELGSALMQFGLQTGSEVLFVEADLEGKTSNSVDGTYTSEAALELLLSNTGVDYRRNQDGTLLVGNGYAVQEISVGHTATEASSQSVQVDQATVVPVVGETITDEDEEARQDTIVVTGTNIRGVEVGSSPVIGIDRADIDASGFTTVAQVLSVLPQNFGGGSNEDTSEVSNAAFGSGINLRGLGADATLTLINGRRLPAAGADANFTDISSIPLSAVDRIEVLTDGASAVYGTDAVAGVVNVILKTDFDGAETSVRYGSADGDFDELTVSQIFGRNWSTGNALLVYEYYDRGNLESADRDFTANTNLTSLGGDDFSLLDTNSNPGNILNPFTGQLAAIPSGQNGTGLSAGDILLDSTNFQNRREQTDVLPQQERHSLYAVANQDLTEAVSVYAEARYTDRSFQNARQGDSSSGLLVPTTHPNFIDPFGSPLPFSIVQYSFIDDLGPVLVTGDVETLAGVAGSTIEVGGNWNLDLFATYTQETIEQQQLNIANTARLNEALGRADADPSYDPTVDGFFNPFGDGGSSPASVVDYIRGSSSTEIESSVWSANGILDGTLFDISGGSVRGAVGFQYRDESFETSNVLDIFGITPGDPFGTELGRDVTSLFAETLIPFVGEGNAQPFMERLELSLAVRYEDYSDFGDTTNPKIGILYAPTSDLILRGSFGTSFRAPNLTQLDPVSSRSVLGGFIPNAEGVFEGVLIIQGDGEDLQPESADTLSLGFSYAPTGLDGLKLEATYYEIDFEDRISSPGDLFTILIQEDIFAPIVDRDFALADAAALINGPMFFDNGLSDPAGVNAIIDAREQNLARTKVSGIDFLVGYSFENGAGDWDLSLSGNYLMEFEEALTTTSPFEDFADTVNNPVDLRVRGGIGWSDGPFSANLFVNYTDGYDDNISSPERSVDALTTADARLAFQPQIEDSLLSGTTLALTITNLTDEDPPFVNNVAGIGYDPANGDPTGRFVALQATKRW